MTLKTKTQTIEVANLTPAQQVEEVIHLEQTQRGIGARLKELRTALLNEMVRSDVLTLKTSNYTVTQAKRTTIRVNDDLSVKEQLEDMGKPVFTKTVLDMKLMKSIIETHIDELNDATKTETPYISIRLNKDK